MRCVSSVLTALARSANCVSTSRAWRSNSAFTYSVFAAACSRSSTRAPISIACVTRSARSSPAAWRSRGEAHGGFVGDDQVLDAQAVAEQGDARGVERGGGFHVDRVASYARDLTDRSDCCGGGRRTRESRAPVGSRRMLDRLSEPAFVAKTLLRLGMVQPERPDRLLRALDALRRWGPTVAGGYAAAALRRPDGHCADRRARLADLRRDRRPRERRRARARARRACAPVTASRSSRATTAASSRPRRASPSSEPTRCT